MSVGADDGSVGRIKVALRIVGDSVDPEAITHRLGVAPTFAAKQGQEVWRRGRTLIQRRGVWSHSLTEHAESGAELEDAIVTLLSRFPAEEALWADLASMYDVGLFCGLFLTNDNQGTDLRSTTLQALAARRLTLSLDIYSAF